MPEKEVMLSALLHLPDVSSRENLITYKRRRVSNKSPKPAESSGTLMKWKIKKKGRDMGWAHGKMINSNRQHWQCNWCGLTRFGGGVTRLKRHIAGDLDVRQCPSAPAEVVNEVRRNLIMSDTKLKKKNKEAVVGPACQENPNRSEMGKERIEAESSKNYKAKEEEDVCNKDKLWESWRGVLENMLNMPDGSGSGGVLICIRDALSLLNGPTPCNQVGTGSLTKWGRALVDILSNDKFGLLCALLCTNFGDGKNNSGCYFDFSQINASMKEGEYERSPDMFHQDIQKVWEKFERIGREMVDLATSLSGISRAAIENQVGFAELDNSRKDPKVGPAMPERKNPVESNSPKKSTSSDSNPTLDQDELEPSQNDTCDYKSCTCSYCNLPIGEWEHISCTGCDLTYHLACVNPFTEDENPNHTWYCSLCVSDKPIETGTERENPVSYMDANKSPEEREVFLTCGREDEHLIVSCAGCYKAYRTYCMNPPPDSVPNEKWYCDDCTGMRECQREKEPNGEIYEPMKMLICALESLEG